MFLVFGSRTRLNVKFTFFVDVFPPVRAMPPPKPPVYVFASGGACAKTIGVINKVNVRKHRMRCTIIKVLLHRRGFGRICFIFCSAGTKSYGTTEHLSLQ